MIRRQTDDLSETYWDGSTAHTSDFTWVYDDLGRLVEETFDDDTDNSLDFHAFYTYDLVGNRLKKEVDTDLDTDIDETTTYTYNNADQLLTESTVIGLVDDGTNMETDDTTTTYTYTGTLQTGKEVKETYSDTVLTDTTFDYNQQGRLETVTIDTYTSGSISKREVTSYEYDDKGIRVSAHRTVDEGNDSTLEVDETTTYLNDPMNFTGFSQVLEEITTDNLGNSVIDHKLFTLALDVLTQVQLATGAAYEDDPLELLYDAHGSTRVVTDSLGQLVQNYAYDAYGVSIGFDTTQAVTKLLYSGEFFDDRIRQQYLRNRYYDYATGRFNRLDPFFGNKRDPISFHKYLYAHGNPVNNIDPTGKFSLGELNVSSAILTKFNAMDAAGSFGAKAAVGTAQGYVTGQHFGGIISMLDSLIADPGNPGGALDSFVRGRTAGGLFGAAEGLVEAIAPCMFRTGWNLAMIFNDAFDIFKGIQEAIKKDPVLLMWRVTLGFSSLFFAIVYARACFAAGTPLLTPDGEKAIEDFKVGDLILSRNENDANAPVVVRKVVSTFRRQSEITELTLTGRMIETTSEHPFWVVGKGWIRASVFAVNDQLIGRDGRIVTVDAVDVTTRVAAVYNLEVEEDHTYFVGSEEWGWDVWSHNAQQCGTVTKKQPEDYVHHNGHVYDSNVKANSAGTYDGRKIQDGLGEGIYAGKKRGVDRPETQYEIRVAGDEDIFIWMQKEDGTPSFVQFDGIQGNTLIDAKRHVSAFDDLVTEIYDGNIAGRKTELKNQAQRQIRAADQYGRQYNILWRVADEQIAGQYRRFFEEIGVSDRISVEYVP